MLRGDAPGGAEGCRGGGEGARRRGGGVPGVVGVVGVGCAAVRLCGEPSGVGGGWWGCSGGRRSQLKV